MSPLRVRYGELFCYDESGRFGKSIAHATYGAFGKFTDENNLAISDISKVMMTGVGASHVKNSLYGLKCQRVAEFDSIGRGGTYLSGLSEALVVMALDRWPRSRRQVWSLAPSDLVNAMA